MTEISALPATSGMRTQSEEALWQVAQELESNFLAEMLKSAGLGKVQNSFSSGPGEEQFGSFLRQAQAEAMVKAGGIGLSESIFRSLVESVEKNV